MIRLAIVDDHPAIATALEAAIRERDDLELVGSVTSAAAAVDLVERTAPDLVICDLWLDGEPGGLDVLAALTVPERRGIPRVLVLSGFDQPSFLRAAGYTSYRWAENLGCRSGNPYSAVLGSHLYFQSEKPYNGGHYVNLMNAAYDRVGIGVWVSGGRVRLVVDFYHPL